MGTALTESSIGQAIDWAYEKAIDGLPGFGTAREMADEYLANNNNVPLEAANSLIRWQNTKAATSGFLTGLGGIITLPVAIPANITSVMYVQLRMIATIAYMGGHDVSEDRVKGMIYACLTGNAVKDVLKDVGISVSQKLAMNAVKNISGATLIKINKAVGFRLLTKAGTTGIINFTKAIPLVGGAVGATFDAVTTNAIGNLARDVFIVNGLATRESSHRMVVPE
jgi:uncharacterized protein (DUF697 family)